MISSVKEVNFNRVHLVLKSPWGFIPPGYIIHGLPKAAVLFSCLFPRVLVETSIVYSKLRNIFETEN